MTTERKPRPHADVIKAYADGHEIEVLIENEWMLTPAPMWYEDNQYRIKPEPKKPPTTWYQVVFRNATGTVCVDTDAWTETDAVSFYGGSVLRLIPIYTEEE
jgi:hypothetical protein